ncbi:MAG: hypothetical protein ACREN5_08920, partial [Gemmatimonadales bacterium]
MRTLFLFLISWCLQAQIITTFAGTEWIFPGQSMLAGNAPLGRANAVAVDARGNLYIADTGNYMIFRVTPPGELTVFAGNGRSGFSGDNGPATSASFRFPSGVAA